MIHRHFLTALTVLSLVAVLLATIGMSPAHAGDSKIYPGAMCVRYSGTSLPTPALSFSALGNPSASNWLFLDCPVVRDHTDRNINNGWVQVIDMHFNNNVVCSLNSFYRSGSSFVGWWTPEKASAGTSAGPQTLSFGSIGSNAPAHYFYSCRIPPTYSGSSSYIISYKVDENT